MINRIDLFMPPISQYGVLHHFTTMLAEGLMRNGVHCRILQAQRDNPKAFIDDILSDPPECTLSFNGLLPDAEGHFFCDLIKIPHVACLVDSPNRFLPLIQSQRTIITCPDETGVEFLRGTHARHVLFMPHAVEKTLSVDLDGDRPYDVTLLSSCIDYENIRKKWPEKFPPVLCKAMEAAAEATLSDQVTPYSYALAHAIDREAKSGNSFDPRTINFLDVLDELESYINGKDRIELVKNIKDAQVHIFGSQTGPKGWKEYLGSTFNTTVHGQIPFEEALQTMKKSKIILNSCPKMKRGAHERIFTGLACGALVITSENPYLDTIFKDGQSISFYQHKQRHKINEQINHYLSNKDEREQVAARGREIVMRGHTWDHRAITLIKQLSPILESMKHA